jgi:SAM-dependent methyltransferase
LSALLDLLRRMRRFVIDRTLERSGDTRTPVELDELGLAGDGYHDYEPSGWRSLSRAMSGIEFGSEDSFLDIGCGKGRVVAQAARRPFRRVIGVELSGDLAAQAREQADRLGRRQRCGAVEVIVADSTTWPIPTDVTVIYFYNALSGAPLNALLDRIVDSVGQAPREVSFLYVNPEYEADVSARPEFVLRRRVGGRRWDEDDPRRVSIFDVRPEA